MADATQQQQPNSSPAGGSGQQGPGLLQGILQVLGRTALGAATSGRSEVDFEEQANQRKAHAQDMETQTLMQLAGVMANNGQDPSALLGKGIPGMDPAMSKNITQMYSTLAKTKAQTRQQTGAALGKIDPTLAPLASIPGFDAASVIPQAIQTQREQTMETGREKFETGQQQREIGAQETMEGRRESTERQLESSREGTELKVAGMRSEEMEQMGELRGLISVMGQQARGGQPMTPEKTMTLQQGAAKAFQAAIKPPPGDDAEDDTVRTQKLGSYNDSLTSSSLPRDIIANNYGFVVRVPGTSLFGWTTSTPTPIQGIGNAFKAVLPDDDSRTMFDHLAATQGILVAAQAMVQAGKMDRGSYTDIVQQLSDALAKSKQYQQSTPIQTSRDQLLQQLQSKTGM